MKKILSILILFTTCCLGLHAQIFVQVHGNIPNFNTSGLYVTEAGNDFNSEITESNPSTYIDINVGSQGGNKSYILYGQVWVSNSSAVLKVKRISDGTNTSGGGAIGNILGGLDYVQLSDTPVQFFTGKGNRVNVLLQFSLSNLSVVNPTGFVTFYLNFYAVPTD